MSLSLAMIIIPRLVALLLLGANAYFLHRGRRYLLARGMETHQAWAAVILAGLPALPLVFALILGFPGYGLFRALPPLMVAAFQVWHTAILFCATGLLVGRIARRLFRRHPAPEPSTPLTGRRRFLQGSLFLLPAAMSLYTSAKTASSRYDCVINERPLSWSGLPAGDRTPLRLVQISDLHMGTFFGPERLEYYFDRVRELQPDLVFFTGDLIDSRNRALADTLSIWRDLTRHVTVVACMGNHDYFDDRLQFHQLARAAGIELLLDERVRLRIGDVPLDLGGIRFDFDGTQSRATLERIYATPAPEACTILLAHNPMEFDHVPDLPVDHVLSGHTHGGQVVLVRGVRNSALMEPFFKYIKGSYTRDHQSLYVNSGLGSWFALRINCPPEITLFRL